MTTHEQYVYYKDFAYKAFEYCNGKINRFINCTLEVDYADMVNFTFANIRRPNNIFIHIDNIVTECGNGYNKNKIFSLIFIAIVHELFHVEQVMSQELYKTDKVYKISIEKAVEYSTYNWLLSYKPDIDRRFNMYLDLSYLEDSINRNEYKEWDRFYRSGSVEELYKYTIMNIVFRNDASFKRFDEEVLSKYENIIIVFENNSNFLIKSNGEFCDYNLKDFVLTVSNTVSIYDRYTINVSVTEPNRDKSNVAVVRFTLSNRLICPLSFGSMEKV